MTPDEAIRQATQGDLRPVYLVVGEERYLVDQVVSALREAAGKGGIAGFNEDKFVAGEVDAGAIVGAARMIPMMAPRRLLLVRDLERWEKKADDASEQDRAPAGKRGSAKAASPLDDLAEYAKNPVMSTVMVLVATKLHGQRRIVTAAKKGGFLVGCDTLHRRELPGWIERVARDKGHPIAADVADHLAEIAGPELGYVADALERLSLYLGPGKPITEQAVAHLITKVRPSSVWELIDALGRRRLDRALATIAEVVDPRDGGLKLLGAITWSVRQMIKFESAQRDGASAQEAAHRAGVAPFKANDMAQAVRTMPKGALIEWAKLLAEADLALKSSRRSPQAVLETMVIQMCR